MKIFITGASGFIGSAIVKDLLEHNYEVVGLACSESSAKKIKALGAEVHFGNTTDLESLKGGIESADGIIHTAFNHDFTRFHESCKEEKATILAMGKLFKGTNRPIVITAAAGAIATGSWITEDHRGTNPNIPRIISETTADELVAEGLNISVVRLPPSVHGVGDRHGFIPTLVNLAKRKGKFAYIENGMNSWAAVNRLDVPQVYRLAMEKNSTSGKRFHAVAESQLYLKDITSLLAKNIKLPVVSISKEEAPGYFEGFIHFAQLNIPIGSELTQKELGWKPKHTTLFEDIENMVYFLE